MSFSTEILKHDFLNSFQFYRYMYLKFMKIWRVGFFFKLSEIILSYSKLFACWSFNFAVKQFKWVFFLTTKNMSEIFRKCYVLHRNAYDVH